MYIGRPGGGNVPECEDEIYHSGTPLAALQRLQFIERLRPVRAQQAREATVSKQLASCLAARAVVGLVVRVTDALNLFAAPWTRLAVAAMSSHARAKRRHFFGEPLGG